MSLRYFIINILIYFSLISDKCQFEFITNYDVENAIDTAMKWYNRLERSWSSGVYDLVVKEDHRRGYFKPPRNRYVQYSKYAMIKDKASQILAKKLSYQLGRYEISDYLDQLDVSRTFLGQCPLKEEVLHWECPLNYRTIEGHCNNLKHPTWGMAELPPQRLIPAVYNDGVSEIRRSVDGHDLPNARILSTTCLPTKFIEHDHLTVMMTSFGQLIDHDITLFPVPTGYRYPRLNCCPPNIKGQHPLCYGLKLPYDDEFYSQHDQNCMQAMRSLPGVGLSCNLGARQQINQLSNYIDASTVYGNTPEEAHEVRLFYKGLLKVLPHPFDHRKKPLLPLSNQSVIEECLIQSVKKHPCFMAGEMRSNENTPLTTMHIVFLREHNRMAEKLWEQNPHWSDEKIFQETRRILAAVIQHITYREYLPKVFGEHDLRKHGLRLSHTGYFTGYDENEDATIINAFSTAAFRFSHSLLNADIFRVGYFNNHVSLLPLRKMFFQPKWLFGTTYPLGVDPLIKGSTVQLSQALDTNIAVDVKNHLYQINENIFGMDLMSLNIIRGRDNGMAPYNDWREYCGLQRLKTWSDAYNYLYPESVNNMSRVYNHVNDIDLWIGGISEIPLHGSLIGPTFACIVGIQFRKLRYGDRFWYENAYTPGVQNYPFTPNQLQEIRKVSLARILCLNSDSIFSMQRDVFLTTSFKNPLVSCESFGDIDLEFWRE